MVKKTAGNPVQVSLEAQLVKAKAHMSATFPEFAKKINAMRVQATWNCNYGGAVAWTASNCIWFSANYGKYRVVSEMDEEMGRVVYWIEPPSDRSKALNLLNYRTAPMAKPSEVDLRLTDEQQATLTIKERVALLRGRCDLLNGKITDKVTLSDAFYVESVLRHEIAHLISRQFLGHKVPKLNPVTGEPVMRLLTGQKDANGARKKVPYIWTLRNSYTTHTSDIWVYTMTEWARRNNIPFFNYSQMAQLRALLMQQNEEYELKYSKERSLFVSTCSHFLFNISKETANQITTFFNNFADSVIERNEDGKRIRNKSLVKKHCLHCNKLFIARRSSTKWCQDVWQEAKLRYSCRVQYHRAQAKLQKAGAK